MTDHDEPFIVAIVKGIRRNTAARIEIDSRSIIE